MFAVAGGRIIVNDFFFSFKISGCIIFEKQKKTNLFQNKKRRFFAFFSPVSFFCIQYVKSKRGFRQPKSEILFTAVLLLSFEITSIKLFKWLIEAIKQILSHLLAFSSKYN